MYLESVNNELHPLQFLVSHLFNRQLDTIYVKDLEFNSPLGQFFPRKKFVRMKSLKINMTALKIIKLNLRIHRLIEFSHLLYTFLS